MKFLHIFFLVSIFSCNQHFDNKRKKELWSMVQSNNVDRIIKATLEIQKARDTSMIDAILYKAEDPRITHNLFQNGMSVYQIKMSALKQITGFIPPKKITYRVDTSIINFYEKKIGGK